MFKLLIITILLQNSFAKVHRPDPSLLASFDDVDNINYGLPLVGWPYVSIIGDPLWVLHLNDWSIPNKLVLGNTVEQEDFYNAVRPISPRRPILKKNDPNKPNKPLQTTDNRSNDELKREIIKIINKFALHTSVEPDSYLTENFDGNNPSITLYFKGSYTCLIVTQGNKQWHYVLNTSPFPSWFNERHDTFEAPLAIPEDIKNIFYKSLLNLLEVTLNYPI